jgi:SAM-dependent methyltransferase
MLIKDRLAHVDLSAAHQSTRGDSVNDALAPFPLEEHQRLAAGVRHAAVVVTNILERYIDPTSVLDLGCGTGMWLRVLAANGHRQVFGVEQQSYAPGNLEVHPDLVLTADLGQHLDLHRRFDLLVCLEVAEHIDGSLADVLVANCVRHANVVLFSAALPGQQGLHHVNEQLPQYWVEQFAQHNYAVFDFIRPQIWDDPQIPVWYRQNILLFVRQDTAEMAQILAQSSREAFPPPLGIAHPDHLLWLSNQERAAVADLDLMRQRSRQAQADFNLALGDAIKRGEEQARADAETIRAEAVQQQELERLARQAAEAALNEASRQRELEREARAATEARLEDAQQQQELERQARVAAEASLATLTHELQAERQAHLAAGMPAVEPSSEPPAWLALERARDDAVRQLQKAQGARQAAEAALAEVTEQHAFEREIRLAAEATRDQALHERALERQARAAAEAGFADAVHQQEAARHAHAAAVAAHAEAIRHAESIGQAHDEAMRQLATEIAARETAEASVVELNEILRQKDAARVAVEARLENKLRDLDLEIAARRQAEAELAETRRRLAAESATLVAVQAGLAAMRQSEFRAREAQAESEQARLEALRDYEAAAEARALAESELNLAREAQVLAESELNLARQQIEDEVASRGAADASFREARQRLAEETDARRTLQDQHYRQTQELLAVRHHAATLAWERNVITNSALWRLTQPLRALGRRIPFGMRLWMRRYIGAATTPDFATAPVLPHTSGSAMSQPPAPSSAAALEAADSLPQMEIAVHDTAPSRPLCVVFVSGEPNIPGHIYRVQRYMEAAKALGAVSSWLPLSDVVARGEDIARANVLVIWRAPNGPEVSHALWVARSHGVKILFDVDDLMFDPSLASRKIIDGIRTQDLTETEVANYFQRVREVVVQADACTCSTEELARHLRETDRVTFVLPNHFDNDTLTRSRLAVRRRDRQSRDIVRIGYAAGTRTHQRDFRNAAEALAPAVPAGAVPRPRDRPSLAGSNGILDAGTVRVADRMARSRAAGGPSDRIGAVRHQPRAVGSGQSLLRGQERAEIFRSRFDRGLHDCLSDRADAARHARRCDGTARGHHTGMVSRATRPDRRSGFSPPHGACRLSRHARAMRTAGQHRPPGVGAAPGFRHRVDRQCVPS